METHAHLAHKSRPDVMASVELLRTSSWNLASLGYRLEEDEYQILSHELRTFGSCL